MPAGDARGRPSQRSTRIAHGDPADSSLVALRGLRSVRGDVHRGELACRKKNHCALRTPWTLRQVVNVGWHIGGLASLLVLFAVGLAALVDVMASGRLHPLLGVAVVFGAAYLLAASRGA